MRTWFAACLLVVACGGPEATCEPADTLLCSCVGGAEGVRSCEEGAFGECVCEEPCVPYTCIDADVECGHIDDRCGNLLACGSCDANETCLTSNRCVCDHGMVDLDGVCVNDWCDDNPCLPGEVCEATLEGAVCECEEGLVPAEGGGCEAPPDDTDVGVTDAASIAPELLDCSLR